MILFRDTTPLVNCTDYTAPIFPVAVPLPPPMRTCTDSRDHTVSFHTQNSLNLRSWPLLERPSAVRPPDTFQTFYGTRRLLPLSQELTSCTYPEPDQFSQHHSILSPRSILTLSTRLRYGLPTCLLLSGFPTNNLSTYTSSSSKPFVLHDSPISSPSTWLF
jgi:hypothetical protein